MYGQNRRCKARTADVRPEPPTRKFYLLYLLGNKQKKKDFVSFIKSAELSREKNILGNVPILSFQEPGTAMIKLHLLFSLIVLGWNTKVYVLSKVT